MFCTKCGKENKDQSKFCEYCGAKLETPSPRSGDARAVEDQPETAGGKQTDRAGDNGKKNHVPLLGAPHQNGKSIGRTIFHRRKLFRLFVFDLAAFDIAGFAQLFPNRCQF